MIENVTATLISLMLRLRGRIAPRSERGDVPGWVLVTLMTAGIVVVLWGLASETLTTMFKNAMSEVSGP